MNCFYIIKIEKTDPRRFFLHAEKMQSRKRLCFFSGVQSSGFFPLLLFFIFEFSGRWSGRTKRRAAIREFLPLYAIPTQRPKKAAKRTGGARKGSANLTRRQEKQRGSKRNAPALQKPNPSQINMR